MTNENQPKPITFAANCVKAVTKSDKNRQKAVLEVLEDSGVYVDYRTNRK